MVLFGNTTGQVDIKTKEKQNKKQNTYFNMQIKTSIEVTTRFAC